ncbi:MAG: GNAT family N-acetyltransferase [Flavobacteriaceae bacterium]|nr:GNAT family N-acetyltransferase [Flavobacteriaceae bacterium]
MKIEIKEVNTKKGLKAFVKFPFTLYQDCPQWVPPIIKDELNTLDKKKNPVFNNAEAKFYLAYKNNEIVGRIAAIINWVEVKEQKKAKVRFGWFDTVNDIEVTRALLDTVVTFGKQHQLEYLEGPVGFSNLDKAGMLVHGFNELNTMITLYNYDYYHKHLEELGFKKQAEWVEFKIQLDNKIKDKVIKFSKLIKKKFSLDIIQFKSSKEIIPYVDEMFDLLNKTYSSLQTYVPIQQYQIDHYKEKYINFIHPEFVICIKDATGRLIAFAITMPSFSKALKKVNGKLFPLGFRHILKAQKKNDTACFYLIGISPEYQGKGVTSIIFLEMAKTFKKFGITNLETNPELEENKAVQALWSDYDPQLHKRRRTYRKNI